MLCERPSTTPHGFRTNEAKDRLRPRDLFRTQRYGGDTRPCRRGRSQTGRPTHATRPVAHRRAHTASTRAQGQGSTTSASRDPRTSGERGAAPPRGEGGAAPMTERRGGLRSRASCSVAHTPKHFPNTFGPGQPVNRDAAAAASRIRKRWQLSPRGPREARRNTPRTPFSRFSAKTG